MGENRDSSSSSFDLQTSWASRILNQCHPIPGFVYGQASFADPQSILIAVRPRKRSAAICSGFHQPAPVTTSLPRRGLSSSDSGAIWFFWSTACDGPTASNAGSCRRSAVGPGETHLHQGSYAFSLALGAQALLEGNRRRISHFLGQGPRRGGVSGRRGTGASRPGRDSRHRADEIQRGKGHRNPTLVYQIDWGCTRLLWIGKERTVKTFK
jgi:transposase